MMPATTEASTMQKLQRNDLMPLESYAAQRTDFRARMMRHKQDRVIPIGPNASLHFEDRDTIHYQIQEILRVERIFEAEGIEEELAAYNPLIPDGRNWKATFMIEFPDVNERNAMLRRLIGIEDRTWVRVGDHDPVFAIADEDIARDDSEQTSAVHFLRFELDAAMCKAAHAGEPISIGIDHPEYRHELNPLPENFRASLVADLD